MRRLRSKQMREFANALMSAMLTVLLVFGPLPFDAIAEEIDAADAQTEPIEQPLVADEDAPDGAPDPEPSAEDVVTDPDEPAAESVPDADDTPDEGDSTVQDAEDPAEAGDPDDSTEADDQTAGGEDTEETEQPEDAATTEEDPAVPTKAPLRASADDEIVYPDNPVQTIRNPMNTTLDVFDYWVVGQYAPDSQHFDENGNFIDHTAYMQMYGDNYAESGINQGHPLKFRIWDGDLTGNAQTEGAANVYTGDAPDYAAYHANTMQGIVQPALGEDGYPVLNDNANVNHPVQGNIPLFNTDIVPLGDDAGTLGYLFDGNDTTGKKAYMGVNGLFQVDEDGYYYYNSYENGARLNPQTGEFTVGDAEIMQPNNPNDPNETVFHTGYWPFGTDSNRHYFGMHLKTEFSQPTNGEVLNPSGVYVPMKFEFRGDDDVWLYLDGELVGDLGGIHQACTLEIDFQTGSVTVYSVNGGAQQTTLYDIMGGYPGETDAYGNPMWDGNTFAAGSYHTLDFFYMERGNGDSNLEIKFNTISTGDFTAHKSLKRSDDDLPLQSDQFSFELLGRKGKYHIDGAPEGYRQYIIDNYATLFSNPIDPDATPIMPHEQFMPPNAEFMAPDELPEGVAAGVRTTVVADGNVNFGNYELENSGLIPGDVFLYDIREVIPDDAVKRIDNGDGTFTEVTYAAATPAQRAEGGFMKDGIVYTNKVYHYAGYVNTDGNSIWVSKIYLTCDEEAYAEGEWHYTGIDTATFANFDNSYKPGVTLRAKKNLEGSKLTSGEFEFGVYTNEACTEVARDSFGNPVTASNRSNGTVVFGRIEFSDEEIALEELTDNGDGTYSKEFTYYIREIIPEGAVDNGDGTYTKGPITYDGSVHKVIATYTLIPPAEPGEDTIYTVTTTYVDDDPDASAAEFNNSAEHFKRFEVEAEKALFDEDGQPLDVTAGEFTFILTEVDESGTPVAGGLQLEATTDADGNVVFSDDTMLFTTGDFSQTDTESQAYKYFSITEKAPAGSTIQTIGDKQYRVAPGDSTAYSTETIPVRVVATYNPNRSDDPISITAVQYNQAVSEGVLAGSYDHLSDGDGSGLTGTISCSIENVTGGQSATITALNGAPLPSNASSPVVSGNTVDFGNVVFPANVDYEYTITAGGHTCTLKIHALETDISGAPDVFADLNMWSDNPWGPYHADLAIRVPGVSLNGRTLAVVGSESDQYWYWATKTVTGTNPGDPIVFDGLANTEIWSYGSQMYVIDVATREKIAIVDHGFVSGERTLQCETELFVEDATRFESTDVDTTESDDPIITNIRTGASLIIRKEIEGRYADLTKSFEFSIDGVDGLTGIKTDAQGQTTEVQLGTSFSLGDGESLTISGIEIGTTVTIVELASSAKGYTTTFDDTPSAPDGVTVTFDQSERTVVVDNIQGTVTVVYTNTLDDVPVTGINEVLGGYVALVTVASFGITSAFLFGRRRRRMDSAR